MKPKLLPERDDGDRYVLKLGFFPVPDPIAIFPRVWPTPKPEHVDPFIPEKPIRWWANLYVGKTIQDTTLWCNDYTVTYSEEIIEYEDGKVTNVEYEVDDKWYTSEQVGWIYAGYALSNVLSLGISQMIWSDEWKRLFDGYYDGRQYIECLQYQWTRLVTLRVAIDCNGIVTKWEKDYYPTVRPSDTVGTRTTLIKKFKGNVNKGDPKPTDQSWIGTAVNNIDRAVSWAADNGMPLGPTVTVASPKETIVQPLTISTEKHSDLSIPEDSPLALTKPEELLTSYQILIELNDPDGATAIAAYPSTSDTSNVDVAIKGSYTAGEYSHPGYTIQELYSLQAAGTPISRDSFLETFGIVLPEGVSECIITNVNIDPIHDGSLFGDTSYTPGLYVGGPNDKIYYPSNAQEGTITVMHR